jgi:hypothetical protein
MARRETRPRPTFFSLGETRPRQDTLQCYPPAMTFLLAMLLAAAEPSVAAIAAPVGGTTGFTAVELASGRALGLNQDKPFPC